MAKQKETTHSQSEKRNQARSEPAAIADMGGKLTDVARLAGGNGSIQAQADRLADVRLQTVQRQALAGQIGQVQGNWHLRRALARPQSNQETLRLDALPVTQHAQAPTVSPTRITDPSEGAETEAETAARAIVSGTEASVKPRVDMVGTIARRPLPSLRHDWEDVAQLMLRAQQEAISRRPPRRSVPEPPDITPVRTLEATEALIRSVRGDDNFPPRARNGANQLLRNIGIVRATSFVRYLQGVGGAGMAGLVRELRVLADPDRIFQGLGPEYDGRRLQWRAQVCYWIRLGEQELGQDNSSAQRDFVLAYRSAEMSRGATGQPPAVQARMFAVMRKLEQIVYSIPGTEHPLAPGARGQVLAAEEADLLIERSTWGHWQVVYHALGGTGAFVEPRLLPTGTLPARSLPPPRTREFR